MKRPWSPGQLLFAGFEGAEVPEDLATLIAAGRIGGVVLFSRNIVSPPAVRRLVAHLHALAPTDLPLTVAIDQEGGRVQRLRKPWTEWPPMRDVGDRDDPKQTEALGAALAQELADLGIDLDFAPVVDVDTNPDNPTIGDRSFSRTPDVVSRHAIALIEGLQNGGVAACAKHFPGHGDTQLDSHLALPRVDHDLERLQRVELPPFRAAAEAGVASMMTAHVVMSALDAERPATLAPAVLSLLRQEIGYDGLIFSDDLEMAAIADHVAGADATRQALEAGCDSLLVCSRSDLRDEVLDALEALPEALVAEPRRRLETFKRSYAGGPNGAGNDPPYRKHALLADRLRRTRA